MKKEDIANAIRNLRWQAAYVKWERQENSNQLLKDVYEFDDDFRKAFDILALKAGKVLDVGCGFGHLGINIAKAGFETTGIDISKTAIDRATELAGQANVNCRFLQADLLNYYSPEHYDIITDRGCFTLFGKKNRLIAIERIAELLATNGFLILKLDFMNDIKEEDRELLEKYFTETHKWLSSYERMDEKKVKAVVYIFRKNNPENPG